MEIEKVIECYRIENYLNNNYKFYAHKDGERKEFLNEHIELCKKYFKLIVKEKNLNIVFLKFEEYFFENSSLEVKELFQEILVNTIVFHDIGKINIAFQSYKMDNKNLKGLERCRDTDHSIYSSILYIDCFLEKILEAKLSNDEMKKIILFLILNSYIISKHHSKLTDFEKYLTKLKEIFKGDFNQYIEPVKSFYYKEIVISKKKIEVIEKNFDNFKTLQKEKNHSFKSIGMIYIYERFLLSLLVATDYYGTSEFMNGTEIKDFGVINDIDKFYNSFKNSSIYKGIREYEEKFYPLNRDLTDEKDINILRNEMFLDAENVLKENFEKNLFYLEAPTGSGKSNVANNLAFRLLEADKSKNKIIYVYPFNTLVEQNLKSLTKIYKNNPEVINDIAVINSLYPIKESNNSEDYDPDFEKALLNRQFLNYPMILTTHVSLFNYFFGTSKEDIFPVHQLINSVIIFDEIQSYKNKIWREVIEFLNIYSEVLNIKIIIMSATLPNLNELIVGKSDAVVLIKNREKYFSNPLFKDRVKIDYSLLSETFSYDLLERKIKEHKNKKILVEFIKKASAYEFFNYLMERKEQLNIKGILLLTGDDNLVEREKIIDKVKDEEDVVLIATQVIEAGVDIDMDIGMKDISILDNEEQFLGRINRSCLKKDSIVYFFDKDDASIIYKEDVRKDSDLILKDKSIQSLLLKKSFYKYYDKVNEKIFNNTTKENNLNTRNFFLNEVNNLSFEKVFEKMKLIDDTNNDITIFLNREIEVDREILIGENIWNEYKELLSNKEMSFAERKIKLSKVRAKLNYFIYRIRTKNNFSYSDRIGEVLYLENGEDYFKDGKLDKEKFQSNVGEFI